MARERKVIIMQVDAWLLSSGAHKLVLAGR